MCEINNLPNDEEKYDKILNHIDKNLGDIDGFVQYAKNNEYYHCKQHTERIFTCAHIYFNDDFIESKFNKIKDMWIRVSWQSYHIEFTGNEGSGNLGIVFDKKLNCDYFLEQKGIEIFNDLCFDNSEITLRFVFYEI